MIKLIVVLSLIGGIVGFFGLIPMIAFVFGYFTCVWVALLDEATSGR